MAAHGTAGAGMVHPADAVVVDEPTVSSAHALGLRREVLDASSLAIVEVDMARRVLYANPAAIRMLGAPADYRGLTLESVFLDDKSKERLDEEIARRRAGFVGNYRVTARRMSDQREIALEITGLPITDDSGKVVIGLGLFRSLEQQEFAERVRKLNRPRQTPEELLAALDAELRRVIPYERMTVARMSADMNHIKGVYPSGEGSMARRYKRWWLLSEGQKKWYASAPSSVIPDLEKFFDDPVWAPFKTEPAVQELLRAKIKGVLRRDVCRDGRAVLSISLMGTGIDGFTKEQQELFMSDAVGACVLQAYEIAESQRVSKRFELLKALNKCTRVDEACSTLASNLVRMFDWAHVSIFRVDHAAGTIRLLAQHFQEDNPVQLPDRYRQPIKKGILGRVVTTGECQNVPDVDKDRDYVRSVKTSRVKSELCVPVRAEGETDVRWIINVEDAQESAFAYDEYTALEEIANEVGGLMQRIADLFFLTQCFEHASEAIFVTDAELRLRRANLAAARLLGFKDTSQVTGILCDVLQDASSCSRLCNPVDGELGEFFVKQVGVAPRKGRPRATIPVHISRRDFPEGLSGSIFVARDTRGIRQSVQSSLLEKAAYSVAVETCTPLSASIAELESIVKHAPESANVTDRADSALDRVLRQLGRVRQGYLRLAMFNPEARPKHWASVPLNVQAELEALARNLAAPGRVTVEATSEGVPPVIQGDHFQVRFVLETLLVAMLRHAPEDEPVAANVSIVADNVRVDLRGYLDGGLPTQQIDAPWVPSDADMAIAKPLLDEFVANNQGAWRGSVGRGRRAEVNLQFPLWR